MTDRLHRALGFTWRTAEAPVAAFSGLFGGSPKPPPPPPVQPMPDLMDPAILAAKQRQAELAQGSSGRLSTILTGGAGNDYTGQKLGSQ
jgi:hypothetical protein